ncbi:MAG: TRAP transporter TatT component family protein [Myxococcota bacterium]
MNVAVAFILCLGSLAAQHTDALESVMATRLSEERTRAAIRVLRSLQTEDADLALSAALLQAEHFLAAQYLDEERRPSLLRRSVKEGLTILSQAAGRPVADFKTLAKLPNGSLPKDAAEVLFWTTVSYGRLINTLSVFERPGAAVRFHDSLMRVVSLDETVFHGAAHRALALYKAKAPSFLRGDKKAAFQHAVRAMQLAPEFAGNAVVLARVALDSGQSRERIPTLLRRGLNAPLNAFPGDEPEQARAKRRAQELLEDLD